MAPERTDTRLAPERMAELLEPEPEPANLATRPEQQEPRRAQVVRPLDETRAGQTQAVERVIVRHSEAVNELFGAMAAAQGLFEDLERTRTARIQSTRAQYTFEYETLADVIEATKKGLAENGLSVWQFPFPGAHSMTLRTMVGHKSGQWIYNDLTASIDGTEPKSVSSGITYLCRYARKAILGIAAGWDDDAEAATPQAGPKPAQRKSEQQQAPRAAEAPPPQAASRPAGLLEIGVVTAVDERKAGTMVTLSTGYRASTRNPDFVKSLKVYMDLRATVELVTIPSSDPAKYAPIIDEVILRKREPGEEG